MGHLVVPNRVRLTDRNIKTLPPAPNPHWDTLVTGFGLRVGVKTRTYVIKFRFNGEQPTMKLGRVGQIDLGDARQRAKDALLKLDKGLDPRVDYEARDAAEKVTQSNARSFKKIAEHYLTQRAARVQNERTLTETKRVVEKVLIEAWGNRPIDEITKADVNAVLDPYMDDGHDHACNRVFERIRSIFRWAVERGTIETSPVANMQPPGAEISRDRWLDQDEVKAVWNAATTIKYPFGAFIQLSFALGGQRKSDIANLRRSQLTEMELREGDKRVSVPIWLIDAPTKSDRPHVVPISTLASELIAALPRHNGDYLISSTGGELPLGGWSKYKRKFDAIEGIKNLKPWVIHDIRRTVSTHLAEYVDQPPHVAEIIQNRRTGQIQGVTRVYNRAQYLALKRDALESWGNYLKRIVSEKKDEGSTANE